VSAVLVAGMFAYALVVPQLLPDCQQTQPT
jgi:hypothetical protein